MLQFMLIDIFHRRQQQGRVVTTLDLEMQKNKSCSLHINLFVYFTTPKYTSIRIIATEGWAIARCFKPFNCAQTSQRFTNIFRKIHSRRKSISGY